MSERARELAERFEQLNTQVIALVEGCTEEQWRAECPGEGRSVAVVAHHIAAAYPEIVTWMVNLAAGQPVTMTMAQVDQLNARHAAHFAHCTQAEVADLLRRNGADAVAVVGGLSDEQLDRAAPAAIAGGQTVSAAQLAKHGLSGHTKGHLTTLRTALSPQG
ncbi:MAG: DinB family protein [Ktedonobacterales bacterium]|nr:DinB family protein [Ktedonobacterales bacterium]